MPYVIQLVDGRFAPKTRGQTPADSLQNAGVWISKAAAIKQLDPRFYWHRDDTVPDTGARVREVQLTFVDEN